MQGEDQSRQKKDWTDGSINRRTFIKGALAAGLFSQVSAFYPSIAGADSKDAEGQGVSLAGLIDMHIHPAPDVVKRRYDDVDLARDAQAHGAKAVVLKSHFTPTAGRAADVEKTVPGVRIFGSITLNPQVGGINPMAVETAVKMGAKVVWLPTAYASNERKRRGKSDGIETVVDGKVVPDLSEVLKLVARNNIVLGTGHLSAKEIFVVVEEAKKLGVKKIVITHPEQMSVNLSLEDQKLLAPYGGVYFERCYSRLLPNGAWETNFERNLQAIEHVGYETTLLATDGGQVENPTWSEAWRRYLGFMYEAGAPEYVVQHMTRTVPAELLSL